MSLRIDRRQFLKAAAITGGAIGAGVVLPKGLQRRAGAITTKCRLGGNMPFIKHMEPLADHTFSAHRVYRAWGEEVFTPDVVASVELGRRLVVSIFPAVRGGTSLKRWANIASGKYDSDIKNLARQLKAFTSIDRHRVGLCLHHEPEDNTDALGGAYPLGEPADFRAAFRHFFSVLSAHRVDNVARTLILTGGSYNSGRANDFWPGAAHVDRLGVDCYNWYRAADHPDAGWRSFAQCVSGANNYAAAKQRILWVCETGTLEDPSDPNRKAQWITEMGETLKTMPRIRRLMYFQGGKSGWCIDEPPQGSTQALAAYRGLLGDPYFI